LSHMLRNTDTLLHQAALEEQIIQSTAHDAQLQLNDAQERMHKAMKLVEKIDKDQKRTRSRQGELRKQLTNHTKELQGLQLREDGRQKHLVELIRESGTHAETEDELDFGKMHRSSSQLPPEVKAYMARARLLRSVRLVILANRIEALKMQEDEEDDVPGGADITAHALSRQVARARLGIGRSASSTLGGKSKVAKGAIFREVVLAIVRDSKEREEVLQVWRYHRGHVPD
jgi:chromosome segregation ATPase